MAFYLLLGPLFLLVAVIFKIYSPKKINHYFGYRTKRSMAGEEAWKESNDYASSLLVWLALFLNVIQLILFLWLEQHVAFLMVGVLMSLAVLLIIPLTELHLRKKSGSENFSTSFIKHALCPIFS